MKISIAGAGAGKTTKIADSIIECYENSAPDKVVFGIAYTNNATECIGNKILQYYGYLPERIHVCTIHSFLYHELIKPYYYLLFGTQINGISAKDLSSIKPQFKNAEYKKLEEKGYLHVEAISERAKWVFVKKSSDIKKTRDNRKVIQNTFMTYCGGIFLDEAQDINDDILEIILQFQELGINMMVMGDPKQDLRGYGNLRKLIKKYPESVKYVIECYRCPSDHLALSNLYVEPSEKQISHSKIDGKLTFVYETELEVERFISENNFGMIYISEKNDLFDTHMSQSSEIDEALFFEIKDIFKLTHPNDDTKKLSRAAYYFAEKLTYEIQKTHDVKKTINGFTIDLGVHITQKQYASLATMLSNLISSSDERPIMVSSIDSIKGMEADNCLFILTPDLTAYLLSEKTDDNKTKHKLYVALTRSTDKLTILISKESECKYGRDRIDAFVEKIVCE